MLRWARRLWGTPKNFAGFFRKGRGEEPGESEAMRWGLFDAAQTHRLNKGHWQGVTGQTINFDLAGGLETIRTRARFEIVNNPTAAGMINSHVVDVVGENGPILQVVSDSEPFNEALEQVWADWWAKPDINALLAGVDMLKLGIRGFWSNGEFLWQWKNFANLRAQAGRVEGAHNRSAGIMYWALDLT